MHKQKYELLRKHDLLQNPEFTPKVPAKRPIHLRKKIIAGQQSANQQTRPERQLLLSQPGTKSITDETVRSSNAYLMLQ